MGVNLHCGGILGDNNTPMTPYKYLSSYEEGEASFLGIKKEDFWRKREKE